LGFSDVRDGVGSVGEIFTSPTYYVERDAWRYSINALGLIDMRTGLLDTEQALQNTYDKYAFIRNAYLQRREYQVTDGAVAPPVQDDDALIDPETGKPAN
jgi:phospholipid-binding lipoprotein MlaA